MAGSILHWCQCKWHKLPQSHVAPHFSCLDLRNAMVPLMVVSTNGIDAMAWHDSNTNASGIKKQRNDVAPHFICFLSKESDGTIDAAAGMMWHWCQCQWHQITKNWCYTSLHLSWSKECSVSVFSANGMCCHYQCQCYTSFWLSLQDKCSGVIGEAVGIRWWWW